MLRIPHHPTERPAVLDTAAQHSPKKMNREVSDSFNPGLGVGAMSLLPSAHQRKAKGSPESRGGELESALQWERLESTGKSEELWPFLQTTCHRKSGRVKRKQKKVRVDSRERMEESEGLVSWDDRDIRSGKSRRPQSQVQVSSSLGKLDGKGQGTNALWPPLHGTPFRHCVFDFHRLLLLVGSL